MSKEEIIIQPTFITDYPIEMSPLTKRHRDNPELTERFELMVNGKELANCYSELNDPVDQRERSRHRWRFPQRGDDEAMFIDQDFLRALEYGMPPTGGIGIGIDRLTMMMTGAQSIQDVLFFPQMKPEVWDMGKASGEAFAEMGVPEAWTEHIVAAGYDTPEKLRAEKPSQVQQKLNGYRKKNKLDIPALSLEDVEKWLA